MAIFRVKSIKCVNCGIEAPVLGPRQKYCLACSKQRQASHCAIYQKTNKPKPSPLIQENSRKRILAKRARGAILNDKLASSLTNSMPSDDHPPAWHVRFMVPFDIRASKNKIWGMRGHDRGGMYHKKEALAYRTAISLQLKVAIKSAKIEVFQNKLWIDILVQKPNHRSDAINMIDLVCDAIKDGIGVDDRWFCIRRVDWEIVKTDPQIFIGVSQCDQFDALPCYYCGAIKPVVEFGVNTLKKSGRNGICKECSTRKGI